MKTGLWKGKTAIAILQCDWRASQLILFYRFKTQMQHVQNSEETLENKKKHCTIDRWLLNIKYKAAVLTRFHIDTEVVKAFEGALALLNARMRAWKNHRQAIFRLIFLSWLISKLCLRKAGLLDSAALLTSLYTNICRCPCLEKQHFEGTKYRLMLNKFAMQHGAFPWHLRNINFNIGRLLQSLHAVYTKQ